MLTGIDKGTVNKHRMHKNPAHTLMSKAAPPISGVYTRAGKNKKI